MASRKKTAKSAPPSEPSESTRRPTRQRSTAANSIAERQTKKNPEVTPPREASAAQSVSNRTRSRNAIRETVTRQAARETPTATRTAGVRREAVREGEPKSSKSADQATAQAIPKEFQQRFVQVGRKYYFPDGAHAFTDRGRRLTTPSENTEVIRSLVQIAQARGWSDITVSGTERFRREAWFMARTAGLEVRGYKPTEFQHERLIRAMARKPALRPREKQTKAAPPTETTTPPASRRRGDPLVIVGRLVDYGRAPYRHDRKEPMSFFVKLEADGKERVLWGVDLERALRESKSAPQLGEEIGIQPLGRESVVVKAQERDAEGRVTAERPLDTHRNHWLIEKREYFGRREIVAATLRDEGVSPRDAVRRDPALVGSYLALRGAEEFARQKFRDPDDQKRFVESVRQSLAQSAARGEPTAGPKLRSDPRRDRPADREGRPAPRKQERTRE